METFDIDEYSRLKNIFDETGSDDEFLGFSEDEISNEGDRISDSVDVDSMNDASNSKTSGYGSGSNKDDLSSDSDVLSDSDDEETSRRKREEAMRNRRGLLKNIMSDLRSEPVFKQMISQTPREMMRRNHTPRTTSVKRYYTPRSLPPVTRRRAKLGGDPDYTPEKEDRNKPRLLVRFGPKRRLSVGDDEDESPSPKKRTYYRRSHNTQEHVIIPVEEVTDEMLENIAQYSVGKEYNAVSGTSCHQCRQKTMDTKSCCRNKECVGVRGQFCGPCLQNRYGESVREVLLDPDWSCPVCRGFCNCSICRNRNGKCATGILIGLAKHHGFTNVKDYLASLKSEKEFIVEE